MGTMPRGINYRHPGEGAIEFAMQYMEGLTRANALPVIQSLMKGNLHDRTDKRIKRCVYCGYYFRDKTKPNNSKNCGQGCKTDWDTMQRAKKRADTALLKPKKPKKSDFGHAWMLEYPFYSPEEAMFRWKWRYEVPKAHYKLEEIQGARYRCEMMGGRRKPKRIVPYSGSEPQ
ncbi:hypothetical protein [Priestia taiwanensis]|uniref:Uncharacterized protein n=1 Tax=Priestia taiwanensis TaxID=1347902 RepID=A0A917AW03_9BACI|nr:hypothetical protein [Priestia taiwanensis]MBM7364584.1 hypothetical protein [Priestia taiwanensis]GGE80350.1 hypothetical protein GCM10007140_32350 [Priestia taiwanensis]